jgi:putative ABC transport system permease protein
MNLFQVVVEALRALSANRLRTVLTMLGIVIGITSVVLLLAVGDSMKRFIGKELEQLGTNMLFVFPGGSRAAGLRMRANAAPSLTLQDAASLDTLPSLEGASPALRGGFQLSAGNEASTYAVIGVTPSMFKIRNWKMELGAPFSEADVRASARMVVIGQKIADQFFYKTDPLGKYIRIENIAFQIVGVLHGQGKQVDGSELSEQVIVPITAARANLIRNAFPDNVHYVLVQGKSGVDMRNALEDVTELLRDRHHLKYGDPDDFHVENLESFAETAKKISTGIAVLLGIIGSISLIVGGIGIMNIMLVSVTERTREIGIRMAIGAKPRDVLMQFLTESVVICLVGGVIGILLATGAALLISMNGKFEVTVSYIAVAIACGFSTVVGVFFGFYPARRASRLLPVECLRYE